MLATSRFWTEIVEQVAKDFPDVPYRSVLVDNAAFQLVKNPTQFNGVVLMENMQGDILTDQAGGIIGSLGLMPSACVGPSKSYVEAAHGSAPDIANQNTANPYSMIGSIALMFNRCLDLHDEAMDIWRALFSIFEGGYRTRDLADPSSDPAKQLSCTEFGDMAAEAVLKAPS